MTVKIKEITYLVSPRNLFEDTVDVLVTLDWRFYHLTIRLLLFQN